MGEFTRCDHDKNMLKYDKTGGILRGLSGSKHSNILKKPETSKGIHLFLESINLPMGYMYGNARRGIPKTKPEYEIYFYKIQDREVPEGGDFNILIDMLHKELLAGRQVNVSCIGGHGRTGIVLSILHGLMTESLDPVGEIRSIYCYKAIETHGQKKYVHEFLGLAAPEKDKEWCSKCKVEERGTKDFWCDKCNAIWDAEREKNRKESPKSTYSGSGYQSRLPVSYGDGNYGGYQESYQKYQNDYCESCWMRRVERDKDLCAPCQRDLDDSLQGVGDTPPDEPDEATMTALITQAKRFFSNRSDSELRTLILGTRNKTLMEMNNDEFGLFQVLEFPDGF